MRILRKTLVMGAVTFWVLPAMTDTFVGCDIWWGNSSEQYQQRWYQVTSKPGCTVNGFCYSETWYRIVGMNYTTYTTSKPCTVYRDGVPILTVNAVNAPQEFSDLNVVPGETYTYTVGGNRGGMTDSIAVTCQFIYTIELGAQKLYFATDDDNTTKKMVSVSIYKQMANDRVAMPSAITSCASSDNWIQTETVADMQSINIWVTPNDTGNVREGTVILSYEGYSWPIKVTQAGTSAISYSSWAEATGVSGAWDAKDENGIYNVFRYVFGVPTGAFMETPLIDIAFLDGTPIIKTPAIVNTLGFTLSVEASDNADGTGNATSFPLNASGETRIEGEVRPSRFFRLKATLIEQY